MRIIRIFFSKTGEAAYISHLDLQRVMSRGLRKSGMPVWWSQGFNPHIYMSFALPLPLGVESQCEAVDVKTEDEESDLSVYAQPLSDALPRGIEVSRVAAPVCNADQIQSAAYEVTYEAGSDVAAALRQYNALENAPVIRKTKRSEKELDMKAFVPSLAANVDGSGFKVTLPAGGDKHINPALLTGFLEAMPDFGLSGGSILRSRIFVHDENVFC